MDTDTDTEWLLKRMQGFADQVAIIWRDSEFTYAWLLGEVCFWQQELANRGVPTGEVVAVVGDYSPKVCALLLALIEHRAVVVPLTPSVQSKYADYMDIAEVQIVVSFSEDDRWTFEQRASKIVHPLTMSLIDKGAPGLVLFSSGSTGESKAALHNLALLLQKFKQPRPTLRTLVFLLLDHIGGINTLFHTLSNGGTIVVVENRSAEAVCRAVQRHRVEVLPTSPTFLNLLLISEQHRSFDLSSLKLITYGTEVMPYSTLERLVEAFPGVQLKQTYGLSELGILRSKSRDSTSLWVKVGGEGFETKVVGNTLWIRADGAMLGYLNAASPFDAEGWFNTSDQVDVDGDYIRILGRHSEIINVGGQKVYPAEVEGVLSTMDNIADACVYGERHPLTGQIVVAEVVLQEPESLLQVKQRIRLFCKGKLERYKIPVEIRLASESRAGARFKKMRPHYSAAR